MCRVQMIATREIPGTISLSRCRRFPPGLSYPLLETQDEWALHGFSFPNYVRDLGPNAQSEIYQKSSVDLAMRDAFREVRHFLWGVHAVIKKSIFAGS